MSSCYNADGKKLNNYFANELEELNFFRSLSPYALQATAAAYDRQSPQLHSNRSPRPRSRQKTEITLTVDPPSSGNPCLDHMPAIGHDSRPDIAAWPTPPAETPNLLSTVIKPSNRLNSTTPSRNSTPIFISNHAKSLTPATNSIAAAASAVAAVAARSSPYASPLPSPVPPRPENVSDFAEDSTKLLTMLKAVVSSSSGVPRGRESELRQKIQALEETVAEYERQKYNVMGTFSEYRERVAERERKLEAEYSNKIISLSEEVLGAKKDFETRMKSFQALQEQFEREKEQALEKLRQEHQKEIQVLEQRFSESQLLNLEQKYIIEIQRLEEERKSLRTEKERLGETFDMKLRRAQSLYETELTAAKMLYMRELEALRDHEEALKDELAARQDEFHDRLLEIQHQAKISKDEMNNCKNEVALLEQKLQKKEMEVQEISKQLSIARSETNEALKKLEEAKIDLEEVRKEYSEQKAELARKSKFLSAAETARSKLETRIKELQIEVKGLRNKVEFLEMERDNLQGQSDNQTHLHNSQVQALEAVLESVTKEKETTKEHYEKLLEQERLQAEEREYLIKKEFSTKLNELEDQYNALREHIDQGDTFGPQNVSLWEEIDCLRSEKGVLEDEVSGLRSQLEEKQNMKDSECSLQSILELMKAIDVVKRKVLLHTGGTSISGQYSSTHANEMINDEQVEGQLPICSTDNETTENSTENVHDIAIQNKSVEKLNEESARKEKSRSAEDPDIDFSILMKKIKVLEDSLDEIIVEKNSACAKVQQLGDENRILLEKLEHFQTINKDTNRDATELLRLQKVLDDDKTKIAELNESLKAFKEHYEKLMEEQRLKVEQEIQLKADLESTKLKSEVNDLKQQLDSQMEQTNLYVEAKSRLSELEEAKQELLNQLDSANNKFKCYKETSDEKMRKHEEEKIMMTEQLEALSMEHKKSLGSIHEHELELKQQICVLEEEAKTFKRKAESFEGGTQTEIVEDDRAENDKQQRELDLLRQQIDNLKREIEESKECQLSVKCDRCDEAIQCDVSLPSTPENSSESDDSIDKNARKDRSKSMISSSEHMAMCQKAANRFKNLVSQMSSKEKSYLKVPSEIARSKSKMVSPSGWETTPSRRTKSPCLLTQLCERSLSKQNLDVMDGEQIPSPSSSNTTRSFLSPSEAESRRRVSPSRQFLFNNKNSDKRPAWKF